MSSETLTPLPSLSILIPTLNAGPLFADVLARLRSQRYPSTPELLIIDSGSTDQTLTIARQHNATIHQIPKKTFDHGLTRNMGIERSTGDIVVLMTQDALPADDFLLQNLVAAFEDPLVAGAFARQLPRPDADAIVARNIHNWVAGSEKPRISHITDRPAYDRLGPIEKYLFCVFDNVTSALRRSAWQQIPFHQNAFGEDIEWSKRALESGWKIAYRPDAAVIHSHDRPIAYEYKRNYMCHQTLYRLFGVQTLPARRHLPRAILLGTLKDTLYALRHQKPLAKKLALAAKIPFLTFYASLAQYQGAHDAKHNQSTRHTDV